MSGDVLMMEDPASSGERVHAAGNPGCRGWHVPSPRSKAVYCRPLPPHLRPPSQKHLAISRSGGPGSGTFFPPKTYANSRFFEARMNEQERQPAVGKSRTGQQRHQPSMAGYTTSSNNYDYVPPSTAPASTSTMTRQHHHLGQHASSSQRQQIISPRKVLMHPQERTQHVQLRQKFLERVHVFRSWKAQSKDVFFLKIYESLDPYEEVDVLLRLRNDHCAADGPNQFFESFAEAENRELCEEFLDWVEIDDTIRKAKLLEKDVAMKMKGGKQDALKRAAERAKEIMRRTGDWTTDFHREPQQLVVRTVISPGHLEAKEEETRQAIELAYHKRQHEHDKLKLQVQRENEWEKEQREKRVAQRQHELRETLESRRRDREESQRKLEEDLLAKHDRAFSAWSMRKSDHLERIRARNQKWRERQTIARRLKEGKIRLSAVESLAARLESPMMSPSKLPGNLSIDTSDQVLRGISNNQADEAREREREAQHQEQIDKAERQLAARIERMHALDDENVRPGTAPLYPDASCRLATRLKQRPLRELVAPHNSYAALKDILKFQERRLMASKSAIHITPAQDDDCMEFTVTRGDADDD